MTRQAKTIDNGARNPESTVVELNRVITQAEELLKTLSEEGGAAVDQAPAGSGILVTKRPVEVLAGPSSSASVLYGFPAGRPLRLIGRDAGFAQIQDLKSSATGWIDETALAQPSPSEAASAPSEPTLAPRNAGTPAPEQSPVQKPGRANGRQRPLSGFLGGLFGTR